MVGHICVIEGSNQYRRIATSEETPARVVQSPIYLRIYTKRVRVITPNSWDNFSGLDVGSCLEKRISANQRCLIGDGAGVPDLECIIIPDAEGECQ